MLDNSKISLEQESKVLIIKVDLEMKDSDIEILNSLLFEWLT